MKRVHEPAAWVVVPQVGGRTPSIPGMGQRILRPRDYICPIPGMLATYALHHPANLGQTLVNCTSSGHQVRFCHTLTPSPCQVYEDYH